MRVADRPIPTSITLDPVPMIAGWPVRPVIAIEQKPAPPYIWDGGQVWDGPGLVWDAASVMPQFIDATCSFTGLELDTGTPDDHGLFPPARLLVQLDNGTGEWSRWNVDGTPADHGPGQTIAVWAHNAGGDWWLFYGRIARWDQRADDSVEVEAFDSLSDLAMPIGTYTPGVAGDLPGVRSEAILTAASSTAIRHTFAAGVNHLTRQATEQSPLEELQTVAASDGGIVYVDADGTLVTYDRNWRVGRTDQGPWPVLSDNVCTAPIVIWEPLMSTNDDHLADVVVLENIAALKATATSSAPAGRYVYAEADQQWTTQPEGDALAAWMLAQNSRPRLALEEATVYLLDPHQPGLWRAVDWRRFDRVRLLHDQKVPGGTSRLDLQMLLVSMVHEVTPEGGWTITFSTTRALAYIVATFWDQTVYVWDDANPLAIWGY